MVLEYLNDSGPHSGVPEHTVTTYTSLIPADLRTLDISSTVLPVVYISSTITAPVNSTTFPDNVKALFKFFIRSALLKFFWGAVFLILVMILS